MITIKKKPTVNQDATSKVAVGVSDNAKTDLDTEKSAVFFYKRILSREMDLAELKFRLDGATTDKGYDYTELGIMSVDNFNRLSKGDRYLQGTKEEAQFAKVMKAQPFAKLLKAMAGKQADTAILTNSVQLQDKALRFFIEKIASGEMDLAELKFRLDGATTGRGYDYTETGEMSIDNFSRLSKGDRYLQGTKEEAQFAKTLKKLNLDSALVELTKCMQAMKFGDSMASAVKAALNLESGANGEELISSLMLSSPSDGEVVIDCLRQIRSTFNRTQNYLLFFSSLTDKMPLDKLAVIVEAFPIVGPEDNILRDNCLSIIVNNRRLVIFASTVEKIIGVNSYESIVDTLRVLSDSKIEDDKVVSASLLEVYAKKEIAKFKTEALELLTLDSTQEQKKTFLSSFPLRATIGKADYRESYQEIEKFLSEQITGVTVLRRLTSANEIRRNAVPGNFTELLAVLKSLDFDLNDDVIVKKILFGELRASALRLSRSEFDKLFAEELTIESKDALSQVFEFPKLGRNTPAIQFMADRFREVLLPLFETLRNDPGSASDFEKYLGPDPLDDNGQRIPRGRKLPYEIDIKKLEEQRPISERERLYLESVQFLSRFNPALIALMESSPDEVFGYIKAVLSEQSDRVWNELDDGSYVPVALAGLGPSGIAAAGDIVRLNPELARQMLVIDQEEVPGGPFSIPGGPAWELNSANSRGEIRVQLPDSSPVAEEKTVRAYGSPLRWYPGERGKAQDIRGGSINQVVDYLPSPDAISDYRYPTNNEFALVCQLHALLVAPRACLRTTLLRADKNLDSAKAGDKVWTLQHRFGDGRVETKRIYVDGRIGAGGLGEANFGFKIARSRALKILAEKRDPLRFPTISSTLTAFKALTSNAPKITSIGDTIVLWGNGNSTDTLLENIGNLFAQSNPLVRKISKVYVITEGEFSKRPRYFKILDLQARGGRGNLVEVIQDRVMDVDRDRENPKKLNFYGKSGQLITNGGGKLLQADHGIAAAGFVSRIKQIFSGLEDATLANSAFEPYALPTDSQVFVGETLRDDPNSLLVGTGAKPFFNNQKKIQLPSSAANALGRVGGENAVAIGFRVPETQAAIVRWVTERDFGLTEKPKPSKQVVPLFAFVGTREVEVPLTTTIVTTPLIVKSSRFASALFGYFLKGNNQQFIDQGDNMPSKLCLNFELTADAASLRVSVPDSDRRNLSPAFADCIKAALQNASFQAYALRALKSKRRGPLLNIDLAFANGRVRFRDTFLE